MSINWSKVVDVIQIVMVGIVLFILTVCIVLLLVFDSVVGAGAMMKLTQNVSQYAVTISLVTTGLQTAIAFMAYLASVRGFDKLGIGLVVATGVLWVIDIYFDSLTADILRYGSFVQIAAMTPGTEKTTQILFRVLIGGTSSIGEFLGIAIIVGMPELKSFIYNAIPAMGGPAVPSYTRRSPEPSAMERHKATIERMNAARKPTSTTRTGYQEWSQPLPVTFVKPNEEE